MNASQNRLNNSLNKMESMMRSMEDMIRCVRGVHTLISEGCCDDPWPICEAQEEALTKALRSLKNAAGYPFTYGNWKAVE